MLKPNKSATDVKNYRPISLLSCCYKLLERCLTSRLSDRIDASIPHDQAGFRKKRNCCEETRSHQLYWTRFRQKSENWSGFYRSLGSIRYGMETRPNAKTESNNSVSTDINSSYEYSQRQKLPSNHEWQSQSHANSEQRLTARVRTIKLSILHLHHRPSRNHIQKIYLRRRHRNRISINIFRRNWENPGKRSSWARQVF